MNRRLFVLCTILLRPTAARAFTTDGQEDICADPHVIMCENFENRSVGQVTSGVLSASEYKNNGWGINPLLEVVDTQSFDGTKSLQLDYPAGANNGSEFISSGFTGYPELYVRFYTKFSSNHQWSAVADKWWYINTTNTPSNSFVSDASTWGSGLPVVGFSDAANPNSVAQNAGNNFTFPLDQWVCAEYHVKMNTADNVDGTMEGWIDGVQRFSYIGNVQYTPTPSLFNSIMPSGFWNCLTLPNCDPNNPVDVHPLMYRWYDNIVVSTQRIGCVGSPAVNTPPGAPGELKVK